MLSTNNDSKRPTRRLLLRFVSLTTVMAAVLIFASSPAAAQVGPGSETEPDAAGSTTIGSDAPGSLIEEIDGLVNSQVPTTQPSDTGIEVTPPTPVTEPDVGISISGGDGLTQTVVVIMLLTIGSVAPSIILLTTSFTRFAIVLSLTRNAIGTQQIPPTQVLTGLALFLTLFVMGPIFSEINEDAIQPLPAGEIDQSEAFEAGFDPLRKFMLAQTDENDLRMFIDMRDVELTDPSQADPTVLIPAFVLSELRTAFTIGFMIFIPFLVIDLVVASVLMSLGMVMLPPIFISLPLKLLLFVLVDGWGLIVHSLVSSVNTVS